jgi:hypothetical protein
LTASKQAPNAASFGNVEVFMVQCCFLGFAVGSVFGFGFERGWRKKVEVCRVKCVNKYQAELAEPAPVGSPC